MKMKMNKAIVIWSILALALMCGAPGCVPIGAEMPTREIPTPTASRQIGENRLGLREHWRASKVHIVGGGYNPVLLALPGWVVHSKWNAEQITGQLQVRDATDGNLVWESTEKQGLCVDFLAVDNKRVYVHDGNEILAYDLESGERLWVSRVQWHRGYNLHLENGMLGVHNVQESEVHYLDVYTGEELDRVSLATEEGFLLLGRFPQMDLYRTPATLRAVDAATGQLLWETGGITAIWHTYTRPTLVNDVFLVGYGGGITVVDVQTGRIKWENRGHFVSNFVAMNDALYALDPHARLVRLDIETGQEIGYLQFTPDQTNYKENRYWVASDGQRLFVYFGDSRELIALGP